MFVDMFEHLAEDLAEDAKKNPILTPQEAAILQHLDSYYESNTLEVSEAAHISFEIALKTLKSLHARGLVKMRMAGGIYRWSSNPCSACIGNGNKEGKAP